MTSPRASIIVRCYNEADYIGKLLHGIFEQTIDDIEIILVDSGSTDGTREIAREYSVDETVFIDPSEFSFGRSLNYGCEAATGKFCVFASAHVYPKRSDWLEQLLSPFDDDDIALVYGKQRGGEVTAFSERQIFEQWFPNHDITRQESPFCNNANCAIRRDLWEEQRYDESLTGLEDLDWAKRIQQKGYLISYQSDAEVVHVHDETNQETFNRYRREAFAHKKIIPDQSFSLIDFFQAFLKNTVSDYRSAYCEKEFLENMIDIPRFRFLQFAGTYRGFNSNGKINDKLKQRFYYPENEGYPSSQQDQDEENQDTGEGDLIDYSVAWPDK